MGCYTLLHEQQIFLAITLLLDPIGLFCAFEDWFVLCLQRRKKNIIIIIILIGFESTVLVLSLSLSLSFTHTHTHTHESKNMCTHTYIALICVNVSCCQKVYKVSCCYKVFILHILMSRVVTKSTKIYVYAMHKMFFKYIICYKKVFSLIFKENVQNVDELSLVYLWIHSFQWNENDYDSFCIKNHI